MEKQTLFKRIATVVVAAAIVTLTIFQIYALSKNDIKTQTAVFDEYKDTISTKMFAVRDESYISASSSGVPVAIVDDGEKVAGNQVIAAYLSDDKKAEKYIELEELKDKLYRYEQIKSQQMLSTLDIYKINKSADSAFTDACDSVKSGNLENLKGSLQEFGDKLTTKQILVNGNMDFSKEISELKLKIEKVERELGSVNTVKSHGTGYYVSFADGYEKKTNFKNVKNLKCGDIENLLSSKPGNLPQNNMGKLISGYNWYFVCVLSKSDSLKLSKIKNVKLQCDNVPREYIKAEVYSVGKEEDGKVPVVFCSKIMDEDIARLRVEDVQIIINETEGLRINKDAVRVVNGIKGVYVLRGDTVSFKALDIIYTSKDYVVSRYITDREEYPGEILIDIHDRTDDDGEPLQQTLCYVKLYDEVIIEGKDLKNGKDIK